MKTNYQNKQDTGNDITPLTTSGKVYKTNDILDLSKDQQPIHITKNGYSEMVLLSEELFDKIYQPNIISINKKFDQIISQSKPKGFDVDKDRKSKCLKGKEYIHSIGMWEEYCDFVKTFAE